MVSHPYQQMHKLSEKYVSFSIMHEILLEWHLIPHLFLSLQFIDVPVDLCPHIFVIYIFIADSIFCLLGCYLKYSFNIGIDMRYTSIELSQTKITQYFQTSDHFPYTFKIQTKTKLRLLVIERSSVSVPIFQLCIVSKQIIGQIFQVRSVGKIEMIYIETQVVEIGLYLFFTGHFFDILSLNTVRSVAFDHSVLMKVYQRYLSILISVKRIPFFHVTLPVPLIF